MGKGNKIDIAGYRNYMNDYYAYSLVRIGISLIILFSIAHSYQEYMKDYNSGAEYFEKRLLQN
jgi:hypothetical protein